MNQTITSRNNPSITEYAKLSQAKYRRDTGLFFFEGTKLLREALARGIQLERVFATEEFICRYPDLCESIGDKLFPVNDGVYQKLTAEKAPQGVFTVAHNITSLHGSIAPRGRCFFLSGIQDPGNLGTCIRSAHAFGIDTLICDSDCADIYSPKTVRASMGTLFSQSIIFCNNFSETVDLLHKNGYKIYCAALRRDALELNRFVCDNKTVFAVGNEGHGLSADFISACDGSVIIPMTPDTESLNAAVAASILMYEGAKINV